MHVSIGLVDFQSSFEQLFQGLLVPPVAMDMR